MVSRKLPKEVQQIFDRYMTNNVRRLKKEDAVQMLVTEFSLNADQADQMFDTFDKDKNGIMSVWEFQQFYMTIGKTAQEMVTRFQEMDADGSGKLDESEARAGLESMGLKDNEADFFIKQSIGEDGQIDIGAFGNLLFRLKVFQKKKK